MDISLLKNHKMTRLGAGGYAVVLVPLVEKGGSWAVLFEVRSQTVSQPGEICFPGGRVEENESPCDTAVRECCEELLISPNKIEIIAPLFELMGPKGRFVYSYCAKLLDYENTFFQNEVESVFAIDIDELLAMKPIHSTGKMKLVPNEGYPYELIPNGRDYPFSEIERNFYFYETPYGVIWGMTAGVLYNFLELLK